MTSFPTAIASSVLALAALAGAAQAASTTSSAASDSASSTASSTSDSLKKSSDGSSRTTAAMASGDYDIVAIAPVAERPDAVRLRLQARADRSLDGEYLLELPQATAERHHLAAGQVISARQRPYGIEFAQGEPRQAFFLVIADDWARDLPSHVVRPL